MISLDIIYGILLTLVVVVPWSIVFLLFIAIMKKIIDTRKDKKFHKQPNEMDNNEF